MAGVAVLALLATLALQCGQGQEVLVGREVVESSARRFVEEAEKELMNQCTRTMQAAWNYQTDLTTHHRTLLVNEQDTFKRMQEESRQEAGRWRSVDYLFTDSDLKDRLDKMSVIGLPELPSPSMTSYRRVLSDMTHIYTSASVCSRYRPSRCSLTPHSGLNELMSTSRDPEELSQLWESWRDRTKTIRHSYRAFVVLANRAVQGFNFRHKGDMNYVEYGAGDLMEQLQEAWEQLQPLYLQLHAYVRRKLREEYGSQLVTERGPLPAHLLGNIWGQEWPLAYLLPRPDLPPLDVTPEMVRQGMTPRAIFEIADDFFVSLGLERAPPSFWRTSLLQEPEDRSVVCSASTWDFCDGKDFRVKQCTKVTQDDFVSAHHEMAHLQYFRQYRHLPYLYRKGANPGFHEAIGLAVGLSVATPRHFRRMGLIRAGEEPGYLSQINTLMHLALRQLPFMPFARVMDLWREGVFNGTTHEKDWNCAWWDLRVSVQGIKPPDVRTEKDFDPGAKYQIAADSSYTRYFVAFVLQFQIYKSLCMAAGEYDPKDKRKSLHECDFYLSPAAGNILRSVMKLGASKPWEEVVEVLTEGRETGLNATAMREYYKPLEEWLTRDNLRHGEYVGWRPDGEYCLYKKPLRYSRCSVG
ncbi:angiotensin-converting enzyme-like [Portunus trituberculatus]|uniref:angiotensin-converting enzyme-like n=1 Tax=Portunus trituberculatus TaxID=210409 RepID=UPI001E1CBFE3|nr:angiotensin-converting enzyme-like [Portunus trituberculatus]